MDYKECRMTKWRVAIHNLCDKHMKVISPHTHTARTKVETGDVKDDGLT